LNSVIEIFTDGSCHTQKLIGAWASIIFMNNQKVVLSGVEHETTHNRMEILAVVNAIKHIHQLNEGFKNIIIVSDSQYVIGLVNRQHKFLASHFKTKSGNDIRNIDLVKEFLHLIKKLNIEFVKIKAHQKPGSTMNYNIEVDKLSRKLVREAVR